MVEKSARVAVVPADVGWNDLGSFDSFREILEADPDGNILPDGAIALGASDNLIYADGDKAVAAVGVDGLIVVDNRDALLICKKDESQRVREVVDAMKKRGDPRTAYHVQDYRPWGHYKVLEEERGAFKIKRLTIHPGKKVSYQLHYHRSEHWIVARGMARVTIDGEDRLVGAGESVYLKPGQKHRLENPGKTPLEVIEVQMGEYLEEDDIIRFEDDYGRKRE
jgi:mannose-1-phosphate guanylyltransferase/mannose-6-phosphate isomerase